MLAHRFQALTYGEAVDLLAQLHERTRDATADLPGLAATLTPVSSLGVDHAENTSSRHGKALS